MCECVCSYGLPTVAEKYIPESLRPLISDLAYEGWVQDILSAANYWHDVQNLTFYEKGNVFLPVMNNIVKSADSARYKANFMRVKHFAMFGSPDDGTVNPWSTSLFSFYAADGETILDMTHQPVSVPEPTTGVSLWDAVVSLAMPAFFCARAGVHPGQLWPCQCGEGGQVDHARRAWHRTRAVAAQPDQFRAVRHARAGVSGAPARQALP